VGETHWPALTPTLSQAWEREQEIVLFSPAPLLPELGEAARAPRVPRRFSETRQGLGDEGEGAGTQSIGFEFGITVELAEPLP
jgi:hypothetical protein